MAFHHRSSASFSSVSLSRTSHASTSSSQSSPASSPDSALKSSLAAQNYGVSPRRSTPCAIVPFSWEEKPGVLKKGIMKSSHQGELCIANVDQRDAKYVYAAAEHDNLQASRSLKTSCAALCQQKAARSCQRSPHMCLPPYRSHPEPHSSIVAGTELTRPLPSSHGSHHCNTSFSSAASVGSNIMASLSLHKRRHHRRTASLQEDPFWLAMVACTTDADKAAVVSRIEASSSKAFLTDKESNTDSWLAKRFEESVRLDRCIPRHGPSENHAFAREVKIDRRQYKAINQISDCGTVKTSKSGKIPPTIKSSHDTHRRNARKIRFESVQPNQSDSKTLKALSLVKAELQGRCETLLHHQGPPVVDISCGRNRAAMGKLGLASKHKLPDLFGSRKGSNFTASMTSRIA